ncbi:hypothetical protein TSUD_237860, partial [Trifolium subterraneum]
MEANNVKALGRAVLNLKRKRASRYNTCPNGALRSVLPQWTSLISRRNKVVKRMRLNMDKSKPTNSEICFGQSLVRYYMNYKKSGRPERLMVYQNGEWKDFPQVVVDLVGKDFDVKKAAAEVVLNGDHLVLNFLHMYQMNLKTEIEDSSTKKGNVGEAVEQNNNNIGFNAYNEVVYGKLDLDTVQEMFLKGTSSFISADIVEIYPVSSTLMQSRFELFVKQAEITKHCRGDANVRYAWLASSKGELSTMMKCGLGHCGLSPSKCTHGTGVHLAAATCPFASASYCDVDENGVRHLVFCRVIMGNMEPLRLGTRQFRPSCGDYDSGVDDIHNPRYYIVWNMNMNTHIYPEFVVSFKVSSNSEGLLPGSENKKNILGVNSASQGPKILSRSESSTVDSGTATSLPKAPTSPWMSFPMLFAAIRDKVPAKDMEVINMHYLNFKSKKMSRDDLVKKLKGIVGDALLRDTLTGFQRK